MNGVYPRPCGGALGVMLIEKLVCGLSPPVRGSPVVLANHCAIQGSIPARAGEPQ